MQLEIAQLKIAAAALAERDDRFGELATIKRVRPFIGNPSQAGRQSRIAQSFADIRRAPVWQKSRGSVGPFFQIVFNDLPSERDLFRNREAPIGGFDRGSQESSERPTAELAAQLVPTVDTARQTPRQRTGVGNVVQTQFFE